MASTQPTLYRLQKIRAYMAQFVILYHCFEFVKANTGMNLPELHVGSFVLDIFFVMSGFIMVYATKPTETASGFFIRRVARVFPLYWGATALAIAFAFAVPWTFPAADLSWQSILASFAYVPMRDNLGNIQPVLFVGWSLNMEMAFYTLYALSMLLPRRWHLQALIAVLTLIALVCMFLLPRTPATIFYGSPFLIEFGAGVGVGMALRQPAVVEWVKRTPMIPIMIASIALFFLASFVGGQSLLGYWGVGIGCTGLIFTAAAQDLYRTPTKNDVSVLIGDATYSLYILHPFLVAPLGAIFLKLFGANWIMLTAYCLTCIGLTIGISVVSYLYYELPANKIVKGWLLPKKPARRAS